MTAATAGAAPGFAKRPEHSITVEPYGRRVRAMAGDAVIAESDRALLLRESGHAPVLYLPRDDVSGEALTRTDHTTHCPFKGDATFWSVRAGGQVLENVVWGYERPYDEMAAIKDHVAFYVTGASRAVEDGAEVDVLNVGKPQ